jgi:CRISPR-associated protein Cmr5
MQTRDQKYAADVYKKVLEVKKNAEEADRNRYGAMAHQLPILIRTAGLAQALAFLESRDTKGHKQLLIDLTATVGKSAGTLTASAREAGMSEYMNLTRQVMAALLWYKRFAQSVLDIKVSDVARDVSQLSPSVQDVKASDTEGEKR